jgi:hypothetical protein
MHDINCMHIIFSPFHGPWHFTSMNWHPTPPPPEPDELAGKIEHCDRDLGLGIGAQPGCDIPVFPVSDTDMIHP